MTRALQGLTRSSRIQLLFGPHQSISSCLHCTVLLCYFVVVLDPGLGFGSLYGTYPHQGLAYCQQPSLIRYVPYVTLTATSALPSHKSPISMKCDTCDEVTAGVDTGKYSIFLMDLRRGFLLHFQSSSALYSAGGMLLLVWALRLRALLGFWIAALKCHLVNERWRKSYSKGYE